MGTATGQEPADARPLEKGLKTGAIGYASSVVIGVASTAPGYSLAAVLGLIVAVAGRRRPRAGRAASSRSCRCCSSRWPTSTSTRPTRTRARASRGRPARSARTRAGSAGWAIVVADIIVMANLAQIAGLYSFLLFGVDNPVDVRGDADRRRLDRRHDRHLRHRDRGQREDAALAADRRDRDAGDLRRRRAGARLRRHRARDVDPPGRSRGSRRSPSARRAR